MLGLKLYHVSKRGPRRFLMPSPDHCEIIRPLSRQLMFWLFAFHSHQQPYCKLCVWYILSMLHAHLCIVRAVWCSIICSSLVQVIVCGRIALNLTRPNVDLPSIISGGIYIFIGNASNINRQMFEIYIFKINTYRKTSNISRTLVGSKIVDNSDVVGASPVGAAPTTSSFST